MGMAGLEWGKGILVSGHGLAMINFGNKGRQGVPYDGLLLWGHLKPRIILSL
jgi:hypothetical protein